MNTNKKKIFRFLKALMIMFFGIFFVFLIVRTSLKQKDILCTDIKVDIQDAKDARFISENDVIRMISNTSEVEIINQKVSEIDLVKLEERLEKHNFIDNAEVYLNFEGALKIDIVQKKPLYRIINNKNVSYYITEKAYRVPLSSNFTPRLIVATGYIPDVEEVSSDKVNENLWQLINFIQSDPFWVAMIGNIEVEKNGDFLLYPKLKGHNVLLGSTDDMEDKFNKLKIFYKEALTRTDWKKYKQINLKFKGQLICSK